MGCLVHKLLFSNFSLLLITITASVVSEIFDVFLWQLQENGLEVDRFVVIGPQKGLIAMMKSRVQIPKVLWS